MSFTPVAKSTRASKPEPHYLKRLRRLVNPRAHHCSGSPSQQRALSPLNRLSVCPGQDVRAGVISTGISSVKLLSGIAP